VSAWFQISIQIPDHLEEPVSALLFDQGSTGIETSEGGDSNRLTAYFADHQDREALRNAILNKFPVLRDITVGDVPEEDWSLTWRAHFKPVYPTPSLVICPPWDPVPPPTEGFSILIEPKMAFGTGHHETTKLALQLMECVMNAGDAVLDAGVGSGILSIAAAKWGASRVTGVDVDPLAVSCARENLVLNEVCEVVSLETGSVEKGFGAYDLVVANMISGVLAPLLPNLISHVKDEGTLILCGLLLTEEEAFLELISRSGITPIGVRYDGDWFGIQAKKKVR